MRLPLWLRDLAAARQSRKSTDSWRQRRAERTPALRAVELEERRVLAVTAIAAAADISNVSEGQPLSNVTVGTFTDNDANNSQTATIDWGDGNSTAGTIQSLGGDQYAVIGSHTYEDNAAYQVQFTVQGQSPGEQPFTDQLTITTTNEIPTLTVPANNQYTLNEGSQVTIGNLGVFTDQGTGDVHGVTVDWGDGTLETEYPAQNIFSPNLQITEANGSGKVAGIHVYGDNGVLDGNGNLVHTIKVTVFDDDNGSVSKELTVIVNNVAPELTVPGDKTITINEGELIAFSNLGVFTDPGFLDTHTATVDWGDGTGVQAATVTEANGSGKITGSHVYGDNGVLDANGDYVRTIKVTVTDDDGASTSKEFTIIVNNVAPTLTVPSDKTITINEGELVAFSNLGLFTDPGYLDTHTATVDWGDGTGVQAATVTEANGSGKITGSHIYGDNGVLDANGDYVRTIKVTVTDDDGASTSKEFTIIVNNVAPTLIVPGDKTITINEGDQLSLSNLGLFTDPGFLDTHTATVDWGDGSGVQAATVIEANGSGKITGSHIYGDNGVLDANGDLVRTVKVTVTDDDGASTSQEFTIIVNNLPPVLVVTGNQNVTQGDPLSLPLLGSFTDPGFQDTHTATIQWGDGSPTEALTLTQGAGFGSLAGGHTFATPGIYTATVTVTDDDGGTATQSFNIQVMADVPKTPILPPNPFGDPPALPPSATGLTGGGRPDTTINSAYQANDVRDDLSNNNSRLEEAAGIASNAANEKRFILVIVYADGTESEPVTLPDSDVSNLPGLWRRLPDNFYRVYQVQENGTLRLVTQGYVQGGLLVDPNDKNETQDRPPTSQREARPDTSVLAANTQGMESPALGLEAEETNDDQAGDIGWQPELLTAMVANHLEPMASVIEIHPGLLPKFTRAEGEMLPPSEVISLRTSDNSHLATAAALVPILAAGVGIATSHQNDPWAVEVDRCLAQLPANWSRTKALWRVRKPR